MGSNCVFFVRFVFAERVKELACCFYLDNFLVSRCLLMEIVDVSYSIHRILIGISRNFRTNMVPSINFTFPIRKVCIVSIILK